MLQKLKQYLDHCGVSYDLILHETTFTSPETAEVAHISQRRLAKVVMVKLDGKLVMAVVPTMEYVDLQILRKASGAATASLASEREFRDLFPNCEPGAMPPFGNLFGMKVYVADDLRWSRHIAFNAGSHNELVQMSYEDFERLARPIVASISTPLESADCYGA